ncbi:MAG: hypothetical protein RDU20_11730 [Desulfomonilaceae bacterium]|nr:hypothetical protein [Desulfomonilaceae bacterium]
MNTIQNSQVKRSIRVRDFLDDFHSGMTDQDLMEKYHLTPTGLERFYDMLQDRGIIDPEELLIRYTESVVVDQEPAEESDSTSFICPSCLASHKTMFDICPDCGVSFQDMLGREESETESESFTDSGVAGESARAEIPQGYSSRTLHAGKGSQPIEISSEPESSHDFFVAPSEMREHDQFSWPGEVEIGRSERDEFLSADDAEFGTPAVGEDFASEWAFESEDSMRDESMDRLGADDDSGNTDRSTDSLGEFESAPRFTSFLDESPADTHGRTGALCESCDEIMEPVLRDIYDTKRSHFALLLAGAFLVLGFLGSAAVSLFEGYSLGRLFVVYFTGMCLLFGAVLSSVGAFMYLAREKVYYCSSCRRVYPRG